MRRKLAPPLVLAAAGALASCATMPAAGVPVTGAWGGSHVGLVLDPWGGRLDYDCAAGTIAAVVPDRNGRFQADGTHTPGLGGPERIDNVPTSYRARFTGTVRADRMTLTAEVGNGVTLGPFTLRRGAEPVIFRCL